MAEHSLDQFLLDISGAIQKRAGSFPDFVSRDLISALNERTQEIEIGNGTYTLPEAIFHFRNFLISPHVLGYRQKYLPPLSPDVSKTLLAQLNELNTQLRVEAENSNTFSTSVSQLYKLLELHQKYSAAQQKSDEGDLKKAVADGTGALSSQIAERAEELRNLFKLLDGPHLKQDDKKLEETPEEDKATDADKDNPDVLKEKKERRDKRAEILKKFSDKTAQEIKKHKEQKNIADKTLQHTIYSTIQDEKTSTKLDPIVISFLIGELPKNPQSDYNRTYNWTYERIKEALEILHSFIEALQKDFVKLQEETAKELSALAPTPGGAPIGTDAGGADGETEDEKTKDEEPAQKLNTEQERQARKAVVSEWLEKINSVTNSLAGNKVRIKELYLALYPGQEEIDTDDAVQKQSDAVSQYIDTLRTAITNLGKAFDEAAAKLDAGEEIDAKYAPPSAEHLNAAIETLVNGRLLDAWATVLKEETPEKKTSNVPTNVIADLQKEQAAGAQAAAQPESEQSLSDKIGKISRVQHDMLLVAEGELRIKLKSLGLQEPQIEKIINDNRMLLLDTIRYKAFALAANLKVDKQAGFSQIVESISDEVESFYQKLVVTYSDPSKQPQMAGYLAKADKTTQDRIRNGLKSFGLSDSEIYDVISNLEQSKFAPLIEYARANGQLSGAAGLAQILVKHQLVNADQAALIAQNLANGDLSSVIGQKISQLSPSDRNKFIKILEKKQKGGQLSSAEQALFSGYLNTLVGPQSARAIMEFMAGLTMGDLYTEMSRLHAVLAAADGTADLKGRPSLAGPLAAFSRPSGEAEQEEVFVDGGLSDHDKFMLEVSLAEAYRRMGSSENPAAIEVEIALIVHQFTATGSPKGGITAQFYSDVEDGEKAHDRGGLAKIHSDAGVQTDQLANAQRQSYKGRVAQQQGNAQLQERLAQMQLAAKLLKTGGNPALLATTILSDAKTRKILIDNAIRMAAVAVGQMAAPVVLFIGAVSSIPIIGPIVGSIVSSLFGLGSKALGGAQNVASSGITNELGRGTLNAARDASTAGKTQFARARPGIESGAKGGVSSVAETSTNLVYNVTSSMAPGWLAGAAILGPFSMASFFTIIVITVIGGSLNSFPADNPFFAGRQNTLGIEACWPAEGPITTYVHPLTDSEGNRRLANGETAIDIAPPLGRPVYTPFGGRAKFISSTTGYGKYVRVATDKGFDIILGHMSAFVGATGGETITVVAGQHVGFIGSTGNSTGPHVHYGVLPSPGAGRAPDIYSVTPKVYPPTALSPAAIQSAIAAGTGAFSARFADCTSANLGQTGDATPESPTGTTPNTNPTAPNTAPDPNRLMPAPLSNPTDEELDVLLQPIPLPNGGN